MERKARWVVQGAVVLHRFARIFAALPVLLLAALPPAAAQSTELTPIVVALPEGPSARTIGYYLAEAGGWFAQAGLDPEFVVAEEPAALLADGDADLAIDIMPNALRTRAQGPDIRHVAQIFQKSGLVLACRPSIKEPKDLKGMNISLWSGGQEGPFYAWMAKIGLGIYGEADGVTILRDGLDPDAYRNRTSDCFTGETYALPQQLALQGKTTFDYRIFSVRAGRNGDAGGRRLCARRGPEISRADPAHRALPRRGARRLAKRRRGGAQGGGVPGREDAAAGAGSRHPAARHLGGQRPGGGRPHSVRPPRSGRL